MYEIYEYCFGESQGSLCKVVLENSYCTLLASLLDRVFITSAQLRLRVAMDTVTKQLGTSL